jgi:hypothetical protein
MLTPSAKSQADMGTTTSWMVIPIQESSITLTSQMTMMITVMEIATEVTVVTVVDEVAETLALTTILKMIETA